MKRIGLVLALSVALATHADDLERRVAMMAKVASAGAPSFSPDGKRIAFITNISGLPQVWIVPAEGGWPDQITALDDPVSGIEWSPVGDWLALQVAPGGGLNEQVYIVRPNGSGLRRLTEGGKVNNRLQRWMPDGRSLIIASNRRSGAAMDSWMLDVTSGAMRLLAENPGVGSIRDVSRDGKYATLSRLVSRGDNNVYRISLAGGGETHLTPHTPPALFSGGVFAGDRDDVIYLTGNPDRDLSAFGRITIGANGKASPFQVLAARSDAELDGFVINEQGTLAALVWNKGGRNEVTFLDLGNTQQRAAPKMASDIVSGGEFSKDGTKLAIVLSGSGAPQDIWVLDMEKQTLRQVTRSPHPGVDLAQLVRPELVTYSAHDGLPLSGWLYRPGNAPPPYATVLSFHGGPEGQERPVFNTTYQALVANGIAVFAPNVRGSSGFGKKFVNLDNGALRVNGVRDIKASADALLQRGIADPKRLGIFGGSYGGYMVMAGVTEYPDLFAAGADLFGVVNFETFFKNSEPWMAAISTIEYGDPKTQTDMLRGLSPIHKVDRVKTPLLVLHGANDTNVPVIEAEQVVSSLKSRNVPVDYILFPDEGHGWRKTTNRIRSTVSIVRFFKERLSGGGP
jgi:dipeptidyl aminopeptidase/acylaminoacyl peptidase